MLRASAGRASERETSPASSEPELEELLRRADVVTVNIALTDETRGLLDGERLGLLKPSAILVNTARGGIVDDEALRRRLEEGLLGGAVLTCSSMSRPAGSRAARRRPNVLITPHIAWHTAEALARQFEETTDNVLAFLAGAPRNLVAPASPLVVEQGTEEARWHSSIPRSPAAT